LMRSILKQDVLGEARASYWKFFMEAATRYRHVFDSAMTLAVMGFHFQTLTKKICGTEIEPLPSPLQVGYETSE